MKGTSDIMPQLLLYTSFRCEETAMRATFRQIAFQNATMYCTLYFKHFICQIRLDLLRITVYCRPITLWSMVKSSTYQF